VKRARSQKSEVRSQKKAGARLLSSVFCLLSSVFGRFHARWLAWIFLALLFLAALFSDRIAGASYAHQFRDFPSAPISWRFLLGTDALGRDRLARLLAATRISLLLAPAAAVFSTALATLIGGLAGYRGGLIDRIAVRAIDLMLSLPWIFLLIAARALLPLNVSPIVSVLITFALLGALGWAGPARVIRAGVRDMRNSDFLLQARACGCRGYRLLLRQLAPNLKPVLLAQFWTAIPLFILSEANLGLLGLGVSDPLPSWGNLLRELETDLAFNPGIVACLALMLAVLGCFRVVTERKTEVRIQKSEDRSQNNSLRGCPLII
jgi:ABC-type dipeptide/oligopeptide/nickel transport system permease subunit